MFDTDSYFYCPTVSQHWTVILAYTPWIMASQSLVEYSIPIVLVVRRLNYPLVKRLIMLDFPTPESPTYTILIL